MKITFDNCLPEIYEKFIIVEQKDKTFSVEKIFARKTFKSFLTEKQIENNEFIFVYQDNKNKFHNACCWSVYSDYESAAEKLKEYC